MSRYVARRRVELGLLTHEVSIPQTHLAGAEAEADFGEFYSTIASVVVKCWMFVMRLSHSGKAFHIALATQAQEAFLEGHVLAFEYFGGHARVDPTFGACSARRWEQSSTRSADTVDTVPVAFAGSGW